MNLINTSILSVIASLMLTQLVNANLPEDPSEYSKWERVMLEAIQKYDANRDQLAKEKLADYIFKMSIPTNRERDGRPVFNAARDSLLSFPDHAEYFEDKLVDLRRQHNDPKTRIDYNYQRHFVFGTLEQLPSPQVIDLLIRLLDDNQDYKYFKPGAEIWGNDTQAASVLCGLIENPPVPKTKFGYARDLSAWQKWGEQVRDGSRTFQFRGDPQRYNLRGPVDAPIRTAPRRNERETVKPIEIDEKDSRSAPWIPIVLALGFLFGAVWSYLRERTA